KRVEYSRSNPSSVKAAASAIRSAFQAIIIIGFLLSLCLGGRYAHHREPLVTGPGGRRHRRLVSAIAEEIRHADEPAFRWRNAPVLDSGLQHLLDPLEDLIHLERLCDQLDPGQESPVPDLVAYVRGDHHRWDLGLQPVDDLEAAQVGHVE